jgi:hypothetical protein
MRKPVKLTGVPVTTKQVAKDLGLSKKEQLKIEREVLKLLKPPRAVCKCGDYWAGIRAEGRIDTRQGCAQRILVKRKKRQSLTRKRKNK